MFRGLKSEVASNWKSGISTLLSHSTYGKLMDLQLEHGCPNLFDRYGFTCDGSIPVYGLLAGTLKNLLGEEDFETKMNEESFVGVYESARGRSGRPVRRAVSVPSTSSNEWQRPQRLAGYNRTRQMEIFRRLYGYGMRGRTAGAAADDLDIEIA